MARKFDIQTFMKKEYPSGVLVVREYLIDNSIQWRVAYIPFNPDLAVESYGDFTDQSQAVGEFEKQKTVWNKVHNIVKKTLKDKGVSK